MERLRVLITVKTYPTPSDKYEEIVCTAGVRADGSFVRLYPINFRDLDVEKQFRKYQWIEVDVERPATDPRKESFRPDLESVRTVGSPIDTGPKRSWANRAQVVLQRCAPSIEYLTSQWDVDKTSLGIIRPKEISSLEVTPADPEWTEKQANALLQLRLFEPKGPPRTVLRKVPWVFHYRYRCDDERCTNGHRQMIEDWEVGRLYWRNVDGGRSPEAAAEEVRKRFFDEICGPQRDTHLFVGNHSRYPKKWMVIGVFYPPKRPPTLFD